ncbi:1715faa8-db77-4616-b876-4f7c2f2d7cf5 [Thermothielavioides terrestris]|uniref:1715faa8-db77-4616-b876-4f7c2f2d7cf5 n=1 Tax=Thermothielavioides terrestris TaxID=2587410 RepID=A0A3S4B5A2_9PEZI|nr:1715faa8-db77-4616-b876-4f7c2f2d7cf5 [Thermothielavioides terrestris]
MFLKRLRGSITA